MKPKTAPLRWATLVSAIVGLIGLQWWVLPDTYPFGAPEESFESIGSGTAAAAAGVLGVTGIVTAWALGRRWAPRLASAGAVVQVIVLDMVWQRGSGDVDTNSLYALGALCAGALWLLVLIRGETLARQERTASDRSSVHP